MNLGERLYELVAYDPDSGLFTSRVNRGPLKIGQRIGGKNMSGYIQIQIDGVIHYAHRLAWLYMNGRMPEHPIDHINGDRADNRIANLREAPGSINAQNQRQPRKDNKSGFLGVSKHADGKWQARIKIGSKYQSLGLFDTPEEASEKYLEAKRLHHKGCTI